MPPAKLLFLAFIGLATAGGVALLISPGGGGTDLVVHCAVGLRVPFDETVERYQEIHGTRVEVRYDASEVVVTNALLAGGDLLVPAEASYLDRPAGQGALASSAAVCQLTAVIAVGAGNPKSVRGLGDLSRDDLRVGLASPEAAIGQFSESVLRATGHWESVSANARTVKPTVAALAADLSLGALDAAIVWEPVATQFERLEAIVVAEFERQPQQTVAAVLQRAEHPAEAQRFLAFLTASDGGLQIFQDHGYDPPAPALGNATDGGQSPGE